MGKVMAEAFRGDAFFVMPEIFYQASTYYLSSVFSSGSMYSLRFSFPFDFFKGGYRGSFFSLYWGKPFSLSILPLIFYSFPGDYKGAPPFIVINHSGIPPPPSFPKSLIGNPNAFKYCGPRLEDCRGDEEVGIHAFAFFFGLKDCGPLVETFRGDGWGRSLRAS